MRLNLKKKKKVRKEEEKKRERKKSLFKCVLGGEGGFEDETTISDRNSHDFPTHSADEETEACCARVQTRFSSASIMR